MLYLVDKHARNNIIVSDIIKTNNLNNTYSICLQINFLFPAVCWNSSRGPGN